MATMRLLLIWYTVAQVESFCGPSTLVATNISQENLHTPYSNNDDCTINIKPDEDYQVGYYLEIKWMYFDIEGNMPECKDYVEVFVTRRRSSIGKYCSDNSASSMPINMYSVDGYATIRFKSDSKVQRGGYWFAYQLKSNSHGYIGGLTGEVCDYTKDTAHQGIFYSSGWPRGYKNEGAHCYIMLTLRKGNAIRFPIMDLDLRKANENCDGGSDYFQIRVSDTPYNSFESMKNNAKPLTKRYCGSLQPMVFTTSDMYVYLIISQTADSHSLSHRGALTGYITYDKIEHSSSMTLLEILGSIAGFAIVLFGVWIYRKICKQSAVVGTSDTPD